MLDCPDLESGYAMQHWSTERDLHQDARLVILPDDACVDDVQLAKILVQRGHVSHAQILRARTLQQSEAGDLGDILLAQRALTETQLLDALAQQYMTTCLPADRIDPDPRLIDRLGAHRCLALMCLPLRCAGGVTLVATTRPGRLLRERAQIEAVLGRIAIGLIPEQALHTALLHHRRGKLRDWAETCVAEADSCRSLGSRWMRAGMGGIGGTVLGAGLLAPSSTLLVLTLLASGVLVLTSLLRLIAAFASVTRRRASADTPIDLGDKPVITILVPLYKEPETVPRLINRLSRLTWPRHLLDVLLVTEECDALTAQALAQMTLPAWMRVVVVPDAPLRTKPRALNYAMMLARGSLIGVYDAEDAPEPDQLHRVVRAFREGPENLACVQGVLDFYNPKTNWMSRCFTIEYATWFRVILPGIERLGLVVPLGGTTLFFRRDRLEELGGWDAYNVTEDADLGIRLARRGYQTTILETVTYEEACCAPLPWVKQRSRWLKGYAITWMVHMRQPRRLWRDLGPKRFWGFQVQFLGTLVQFALAPLLWSFWLVLLGVDHPLLSGLNQLAFLGFFAVFLLSEATTITLGLIALRARHHRALRFWLPALHVYFPLAVLAVYKALWEVARAPFYWDKTQHGTHGASLDACRVHSQS
jgi:glycosyltransferase XagB